MEEETKTIDEVVVIGYGTVKKSDLTGSVSSVKASELRNTPSSSIDVALQAKLPVYLFQRRAAHQVQLQM